MPSRTRLVKSLAATCTTFGGRRGKSQDMDLSLHQIGYKQEFVPYERLKRLPLRCTWVAV